MEDPIPRLLRSVLSPTLNHTMVPLLHLLKDIHVLKTPIDTFCFCLVGSSYDFFYASISANLHQIFRFAAVFQDL